MTGDAFEIFLSVSSPKNMVFECIEKYDINMCTW